MTLRPIEPVARRRARRPRGRASAAARPCRCAARALLGVQPRGRRPAGSSSTARSAACRARAAPRRPTARRSRPRRAARCRRPCARGSRRRRGPSRPRRSGAIGTRPRWTFRPNSPQQAAGMRIEPAPSDAVAAGTSAAPRPPRPSRRSSRRASAPRSHGLRVEPPCAVSVNGHSVSSGVRVTPMTIAPAARSDPHELAVLGLGLAVRVGAAHARRAGDRHVVLDGDRHAEQRAVVAAARRARRPGRPRAARARRRRRGRRSARGSRRAIRSSAFSTSSRGETSPARTSSAWRATPAKASSRPSVAAVEAMAPEGRAFVAPSGFYTEVVLTRHAQDGTLARMSTYPVVYQQTPAIERSRLTVFFRFIIVIPHLIWSIFYGLGGVRRRRSSRGSRSSSRGATRTACTTSSRASCASTRASTAYMLPRHRRVPAVRRGRASRVPRAGARSRRRRSSSAG